MKSRWFLVQGVQMQAFDRTGELQQTRIILLTGMIVQKTFPAATDTWQHHGHVECVFHLLTPIS
jgi:hypothetical protein